MRIVLLLHDLGDCAGVLSGLARRRAAQSRPRVACYGAESRPACAASPAAATACTLWTGAATATARALRRRVTTPPRWRTTSSRLCSSWCALRCDAASPPAPDAARQDLYVTPLALVGFGLGAAVAARFAAAHPALVAGVALCELWAEPPAEAGFHPGQAARFASPAQAAAFLCADCWVRSRTAMPPRSPAHRRSPAQGHAPRPLAAVARHNAWRLRRCTQGAVPATVMKLDARFFCAHDGAAALHGWLAAAKCHVALLFGQRSHVGTAALRSAAGLPDAARPARESAALLEHARHAASTALLPLPAGHYLLEDAPLALRDALLACLGRWAAAGALDAQGPRAPELLGLRPLPQFDTMDDARKALRPRAVLTRAKVEAALAELRVAGAESSDEDEDVKRGTMLSHQPREYFAFVG